MKGRAKEAVLEEIRQKVTLLPGTNVTIGQPISHRIDHMLSGTRANIAVKIFGDDLTVLRALAQQVQAVMSRISGVVDLSTEQQTDIPTMRVKINPAAVSRYGLQSGKVADTIQTAFLGKEISQILEGQVSFPLIVRYRQGAPNDMADIKGTAIDARATSKSLCRPSLKSEKIGVPTSSPARTYNARSSSNAMWLAGICAV